MKRGMLKKSIPLPIVLGLLLVVTVGAIAYTYWTSPTVSKSITVSSTFDAKLFDATLIDAENYYLVFDDVPATTDFIGINGDDLYIVLDSVHNTEELLMNIDVTGSYFNAGGSADVVITACRIFGSGWDVVETEALITITDLQDGMADYDVPETLGTWTHDPWFHTPLSYEMTYYFKLDFTFNGAGGLPFSTDPYDIEVAVSFGE